MKAKRKNIFIILGVALAVSYSCKKESSAPHFSMPVITRVSLPLDRDTSIMSGAFNEWLILYGRNLSSAQQVTFNGIEVEYKEFYATDSTISIRIPRVIPQSVTNKIEVTTRGGKTDYTFTVNVPPLKIGALLNEYTAPGDTLVIIGENFDLYKVTKDTGSVTFTGGEVAKVLYATADTIRVIVPQGAEPGPVTVDGDPALGDLAKIQSSGWYRDNRNFLFDLNNFSGWNGAAFISSGPDPSPVNGPYFKVAKAWDGGWAWAPFCSVWCTIPQSLVDNPAEYVNYALKFEMYTPKGSPSLPTSLYMCFNSGDFRDYFYDPGGKGLFPFSTGGKWQTFTVPLKNWGNLDGLAFQSSMIMEFMLKAADPSQSNFSICNFRLVPVK